MMPKAPSRGQPSSCEYGWIQFTKDNMYINQACIRVKLNFKAFHTGTPTKELSFPGLKVRHGYNEHIGFDRESTLNCDIVKQQDATTAKGLKCRLRLQGSIIIAGLRVINSKPDKIELLNLKLTNVEGHFYDEVAATGTLSFTCKSMPINSCNYAQGMIQSQTPLITNTEDWFGIQEGLNSIHTDFRVMTGKTKTNYKMCVFLNVKSEQDNVKSFCVTTEIELKPPDKVIKDDITEIDTDDTNDNSDFFTRLWNGLKGVFDQLWINLKSFFQSWWSWLVAVGILILAILCWIFLAKLMPKYRKTILLVTVVIALFVICLVSYL